MTFVRVERPVSLPPAPHPPGVTAARRAARVTLIAVVVACLLLIAYLLLGSPQSTSPTHISYGVVDQQTIEIRTHLWPAAERFVRHRQGRRDPDPGSGLRRVSAPPPLDGRNGRGLCVLLHRQAGRTS